MRFLDFFAGIGGIRRGMELAGHECVGFCEFDRFAVASYTSMHLITDTQRENLGKMTMKQRQKEILKDEYRNGEWYANDIRNVDAGSLPEADCWCFGSPCQDFSVAGKRAGLDGDRSSLIREVFRLLEEQEEQNRPEWLIYENVKGMFSSNRGLDYLSIITEMDRLGYDVEWQNINSLWFVPQNRERIYTVGHYRRYGTRKILPVTGADGKNHIKQIGSLKAKRKNSNAYRVYSDEGISPYTMEGGGRAPNVALPFFCDMVYGAGIKQTENCRTLQARYGKGICKFGGQNSGVVIPVIDVGHITKKQNGRRFKENGDPCFTLTAQDQHGVAIDLKSFSSETRGQPYRYGYAATLDHNCNQGVFVKVSEDLSVYAVWYEKYQCYIAIRKLTPKECFRLQGWTDDYFEKAAFVNSDSQLYKQAGNGVTVQCVEAIGRKIGA